MCSPHADYKSVGAQKVFTAIPRCLLQFQALPTITLCVRCSSDMKYSPNLLNFLYIFPLALEVFPLKRALDAEVQWIKLYGTHKKYSGSWPLARYFREHLDQLKLFCAKAHERWTNTTGVVTLEAYVNHWPEITFDDRRLKPIWADMIMYAEERERPPPEILAFYYLVKGNRPDCVFYMDQVRRFREEGSEMQFGEHVCGIKGFEELASNKSKT